MRLPLPPYLRLFGSRPLPCSACLCALHHDLLCRRVAACDPHNLWNKPPAPPEMHSGDARRSVVTDLQLRCSIAHVKEVNICKCHLCEGFSLHLIKQMQQSGYKGNTVLPKCVVCVVVVYFHTHFCSVLTLTCLFFHHLIGERDLGCTILSRVAIR